MGEMLAISDLSVFGLHILPKHCRRIYIAGPISNGDPCLHARDAVKAADYLIARGFIPYVPHQSIVWQLIAPKTHAQWLAYDLHWLEVCDALLRLPGKSHGADWEVERARELGLRVYFLAEREGQHEHVWGSGV